LKSFAHTPLNRKYCLRKTQFIEPEEVTRLVANVIQTYAVLENEGIKENEKNALVGGTIHAHQLKKRKYPKLK